MAKVTKADLLDSIYGETGINRTEIRQVVDLFLEGIKNALTEGSSVEMRGFGTFEVRVRKGRIRARNPRTGNLVEVTRHGVAAFRPGRELKSAVWKTGKDGAEPDPLTVETLPPEASLDRPGTGPDPSGNGQNGT